MSEQPSQRRSTRKRTLVWQQAFLSTLAQTGNVSLSAQAAGIDRSTAYLRYQSTASFAKAWEDALEKAADVLEAEALRRAVRGVEEPVFGSTYSADGKPRGTAQVGAVRKYSDTLLIFLLKGTRPEKFRENVKVDLTGDLTVQTETDRAIREDLAALVAQDSGQLAAVEAGPEGDRPPQPPSA